MPSTHHAHTSAIALKGKSTRILRSASKISANDLVESFSKMKIKERRAKIVKATPKAPQAPQPMEATSHIPVPTQTQSPMNDRSTQIDVEKLADRISSLTISKPTRRAAKRPAAPAHPYGRPTQTKTEKILHSHGMVKRGAPTNPARANGPPTKLNNATISLLSNSPPCPEAFNSAFNWSTAWLSSGSATLTPASPNTIEAELYAPPAINLSNDDWLTQVVVTVTSVVKKEVPRPTGKTTKPRITTVKKTTPYTKDKIERKQKTLKPTKPATSKSKSDPEVARLADMLALCEVTKGSKGNARLTRSKVLAARKIALHDSGYEAGNEN